MASFHSWLVACLTALSSSILAGELIRFDKITLESQFYAEGASFGDLNQDGHQDIVYGPVWFQGPDFKTRHTIYSEKEYSLHGYADHFFSDVRDYNGDTYPDVLVLGFPGKEARLYLNPGLTSTAWSVHMVADIADNESPKLADLNQDGQPEIICSRHGKFGYYAPAGKDVTQPWIWTPVTADTGANHFTYGLGIGDVNGDGRPDIMEAKRWWEQPADGSTPWKSHPFNPTDTGGAQMYAYDFNGDQQQDILTALNAHPFGIALFTQHRQADRPTWEKQTIVGQEPWENAYGVHFSQPQALALADMDGDGVQDFVTGKRFWAHHGKDPHELGPKVLYWFQTQRDGKGGVDFIPHLIDSDTGVGTQLTVGDINGDGYPDVLVGNKYECHLLLQRREKASPERLAQFQPKVFYGPGRVTAGQYRQGQSAKDALGAMTLPAGFKADLVAAEPDLVQPIAFTWDARGRLWVIEGNTYPKKAPEGEGKDRIVIFSDEDGDGGYETRKIFYEGLNLASGIEVGYGGVWVGSAPQFLFIPDKDGDDRPDGPPIVLLDGWGYQDTHETLNSFLWGPDGWLYGCHGVFTHSKVGKPGTPEELRTPLNAAIWRYHPVRHEFEVFAHGTSNPWGLDYNRRGDFFTTACVIPHLYHILPGGRYQRQAGQHFNPYTYDDIKTIAEHRHYEGNIRDNAHWGRDTNIPIPADTDQAGGGHAHCGLAIYDGDNFPALYQGALLFGNLHGHRLVNNAVEPKGSGYRGQRRADFLRANDQWFIPVTQKVGPDGALYFSDWSDQQVCHRTDPLVWDRGNGRIYRVVYDQLKPARKDTLPAMLKDEAALATTLVTAPNGWHQRMALRMLAERKAEGSLNITKAEQTLRQLLQSTDKDPSVRLRALWGYHALGLTDTAFLLEQFNSPDELIRLWSIRLWGEQRPTIVPNQLVTLATKDTSPAVRRELASLLQRLPLDQRQSLAMALMKHSEDATDPNIPLLAWYGIEPLVGSHPEIGLSLAKISTWDQVTGFIYRRLTTDSLGREALVKAIHETTHSDQQDIMLKHLLEASRHAGKQTPPANWQSFARTQASPSPVVQELSALFGDATAIASFRARLADAQQSTATRETALAVLLQIRDRDSALPLQQLIGNSGTDTSLRRKAIQALTSIPHPDNARALTKFYNQLTKEEQSDAIASLSSTQEGALALLGAIDQQQIPSSALSPFLVRQLQALNHPPIQELIAKVWGSANAAKADLPQRIAQWKKVLAVEKLRSADRAQGKMIYAATCGTCHTLTGEGSAVGPDLTGSNRGNLEYLLENILDPNALIGKDYQLNLFTMKDGRVMSGIVKSDAGDNYRVMMPGGVEFSLAKNEVKQREISPYSTMPEGLFDALGEEQVIKLVAYLQEGAPASAQPDKPTTLPKAVANAIEGESLVATASKGAARTQGGFGTLWSGGKQLWWTGGTSEDSLKIEIPVQHAGQYQLKAVLTKAKDYGIVEVALNGEKITQAPLDLFHAAQVVVTEELDWGVHQLTPGLQHLTIKIIGANPAAIPAHMFGLDYLKLEKKD